MSRKVAQTALRKKVVFVDKVLTETYGEKSARAGEDPVDTLVETILSQNTTDVNSHRSFQALKNEYGDWHELLGEDHAVVSKIIRSGGLPDIKARRILDALEFINRERGRIELDFLRDMSPSEADCWLAQMKGVGPKTRSIVLLFSLGMPAFPVDTHIHRVTGRLGLIGPKVSREKAQEELGALVPKSEYYNFHINLIEHGRAVCRARRPVCEACVVSGACDHFSMARKGHS
ncbi:MAG: Endonuclease [Candidatus Thermoplasmatota archaeon]|nr:Endonuclease [Candidatus Thermoplasmatota archaeon]